MLKIGTFSKLSRVSVRMLRHYDEIGLLRPAQTDRSTGYRYYTEAQLETAGRIDALKAMGFPLSVIGEMLGCDDPVRRTAYFRERREALLREAEDTERRLSLLDTAMRLGKENTMDYSVTVKTIPERTVASLRMTIPAYDREGIAWDILCAETDALRLVPDDPCLCSVVFHDDEYKERDVDIEIQKTVVGAYPDTEHVRFKKERAVKVASAIHTGSYAHLDDAMRAVSGWVVANGHRLVAPPFTIYHVSPHETQDETRFVTEVCYPIE